MCDILSKLALEILGKLVITTALAIYLKMGRTGVIPLGRQKPGRSCWSPSFSSDTANLRACLTSCTWERWASASRV